ncbi:methyl-accepting chemotaxis protein [Proteus mirabilis]|uniref:methyl-accepting chemotaxis protein n=1 Tax=Proteus mirabilis TaxID=584 RepID=UPI002230B194|nr:methyl-accepting chemotaxis protein [Proteus mirabilis]MCW4518337.1 methyl-accepting chemotaxis protein [Proteus mirabilis]MDF7359993.1 methyl-accepting chemotaxis protein [Proteus mirabilis]UZE73830.1 methyl-accepting chemotaxis protein [Proteus mirabilis]UZE77519.1 methyl-accepting chemotaxis protein [Proteus mirabilis]UZE81216.1 methyl-accepting chemotaxis protein [Proteus mirabilis]
MSIKRTVKLGSSLLLLIFILSSALSSFFIYKMQNNFTQVDVLSARYDDVLMARYQLAIMRSNVNYLLQDKDSRVADRNKIIQQNKKLAIMAKNTMETWVKEKKMTVAAQKNADDISTLFYNLIDKLVLDPNKLATIKIKANQFDQDFEHLDQLFEKYIQTRNKNSLYLTHKQDSMVEFSIYSTIISLIILLIVLYFVLHWINKTFVSNLNTLSEILNKVGNADLVFSVPQVKNDEFGKLFSRVSDMQKALTSTIFSVKKEAMDIKGGAFKIASGNQELSSRTEEQSSALQQTAASMEQIKIAVANNTDNTIEANNIINQSTDIVMDGANVMKEAVLSMKKIEQGAVKVGEINDVINKLANQTNILALNAAVEAAKEISQVLKASINDVTYGTNLVNKSGECMQEIVSSISKVNKIMQGISLASEEQRLGVEQIAVAINQMDTVVQQNASLVDLAASSTMMLNDKAQVLMDNVAVFNIDDLEKEPEQKQELINEQE